VLVIFWDRVSHFCPGLAWIIILLPMPPSSWGHRHYPPHQAY
jgi:hypothetical protein